MLILRQLGRLLWQAFITGCMIVIKAIAEAALERAWTKPATT